MKGDFSRITNIFTADKHYSLVLMQQGRVQLDADWNAQALIQWFNMQKLAEDLIGEHGGRDNSFKIQPDTDSNDFEIKKGRYYINGVVCENDNDNLTYQNQVDYPSPPELETGTKYLVYLHAWFRHITSVEDGYIREVALGGPDTTTRIKNIWQVKAKEVTDDQLAGIKPKTNYEDFLGLIDVKRHHERGKLKAQAKKPIDDDDLCIVSPENRYRGAENQLYRVEIHHSGSAADPDNPDEVCATFKWSRENGSVVFPIREVINDSVILEHLGRDNRLGLSEGDWVEVVDDDYELADATNNFPVEDLLKVVEINRDTMQVKLSGEPQRGGNELKHPLLRRWDHTGEGEGTSGGALKVVEDKWIKLEDGIQIMFTNDITGEQDAIPYNNRYWWWIAARTATGDVEWPLDNSGQPLELEALDHGHRYAPLAIIKFKKDNTTTEDDYEDLRRKFIQLWK